MSEMLDGCSPKDVIICMSEPLFGCHLCPKILRYRKTLIEHIRRVHGTEPGCWKGKIKCPADVDGTPCHFVCNRYDRLRRHLDVDHSIKIQEEVCKFENIREFMKWKEAEEIKTKSLFVSYTSTKRLKGKKKYYYICHRSGNYMCKGKGLRKLKKSGTVKIGCCCPATMETEEDMYSGKVKVLYHKTHIGHCENDQKLATVTLTKRLESHITDQFTDGVPLNDVWNDDVKPSLETKFAYQSIPSSMKKKLFALKKKCVSPKNCLRKIAMKPTSLQHRLLIERTETFLNFLREHCFSETVCRNVIRHIDDLHERLLEDSEELDHQAKKEAESRSTLQQPKPCTKIKGKKQRLILKQYISPDKPILVQHSGAPPKVITLKHVIPPRSKSRTVQHFIAMKRKRAMQTVHRFARKTPMKTTVQFVSIVKLEKSKNCESKAQSSDHMYACIPQTLRQSPLEVVDPNSTQ